MSRYRQDPGLGHQRRLSHPALAGDQLQGSLAVICASSRNVTHRCATKRLVVSPVQPGDLEGRSWVCLMAYLEPRGEGIEALRCGWCSVHGARFYSGLLGVRFHDEYLR
jgi:hypothetical protein